MELLRWLAVEGCDRTGQLPAANMSDFMNVKQSVHAPERFYKKQGEKQTFLVIAEGDSCKRGFVLLKCKQR